jgi:hypothetical protein
MNVNSGCHFETSKLTAHRAGGQLSGTPALRLFNQRSKRVLLNYDLSQHGGAATSDRSEAFTFGIQKLERF